MILKLRNSSNGIGDQVCGLYACQSLKVRYPQATVEYYSKTPEWLVDVRSIVTKPYSHYFVNPPASIDLYVPDSAIRDKNKRKPNCRKKIYTERIGLPGLQPQIPAMRRQYFFEGNHVVLVPFAAWKDREWPIEKWLTLEGRLLASGYQTKIITPESRLDHVGNFKGEIITGNSEKIINELLSSKIVIGNDSGMVHMCGLYKIPSIGITSHFTRDFLYSYTQSELVGYGLPSINSIKVEDVFKKIVAYQTNKNIVEKRYFIESDLFLL